MTPEPRPADRPSAAANPAPALLAPPARVMVVEDDETVADVLREVLSGEPYELLFADTAEKAMPLVAADCPDLILTDISLPGKSGLDVMRHARTVDPEVAVILMTGFASTQTAIARLYNSTAAASSL